MFHQRVVLLLICCALAIGSMSCGGSSGTPPNITAQPQDQKVGVGGMATFSVTATGSMSLSYQWMENGMTIAGATSASYTTPPVALADNHSTFAVVVSNQSGSATSNAATLTVLAAP